MIHEMKRITSIEPQKKPGSRRLNVHLDGRYAFSLIEDLAVSLQVGGYLSDGEIADLRRRDDIHQVYDAALTLLSYRPRSVAELRGRLERKGHDPAMIDEVLSKLEQQSILGDEQFAQFWVENRLAHAPRGGRLLRTELRYKGVDRETIEGALPGDEAEEDAAFRVGRAKSRSLRTADWLEFRRKLGDHLVRRGFGYDTAREVVRKLWAEDHQAVEDDADF